MTDYLVNCFRQCIQDRYCIDTIHTKTANCVADSLYANLTQRGLKKLAVECASMKCLTRADGKIVYEPDFSGFDALLRKADSGRPQDLTVMLQKCTNENCEPLAKELADAYSNYRLCSTRHQDWYKGEITSEAAWLEQQRTEREDGTYEMRKADLFDMLFSGGILDIILDSEKNNKENDSDSGGPSSYNGVL